MSVQTWCNCPQTQKHQENKLNSQITVKDEKLKKNGQSRIASQKNEKVDQPNYVEYLRQQLKGRQSYIFKSPNLSRNYETSRISLKQYKQVRNLIFQNSPKRVDGIKSPSKSSLLTKQSM